MTTNTARGDTLREVPNVTQPAGEPLRRWFYAQWDDLTVWHDDAWRPVGFQYSYRLPEPEKALTYFAGRGFNHSSVDGGTDSRLTPLLVPDGTVKPDALLRRFLSVSADVPHSIRTFVEDAIRSYPVTAPTPPKRKRKRGRKR